MLVAVQAAVAFKEIWYIWTEMDRNISEMNVTYAVGNNAD